MSNSYAGLLEKERWCGNDVLGTRWVFSHKDAPPSGMIWLQPGGRVGAYTHPYEARWCIDQGRLAFCTEDGVVTSRYDDVSLDADGRLHLEGDHRLIPSLGIRFCLDQLPWDYERPPIDFLTRQFLAHQIQNYGWTVGEHTYGCPIVYAQGPEKLHMGKYIAVGGHVIIVLASHRPDYVSTYPFVQHRKHWMGLPDGHTDHKGRGDVIIGNDVWIGHGAFIGTGVTIGNGAVIGAHAVVTKDVAPYAVAVGNPARTMRFRFAADAISDLLDIGWWNWPNERVEAFLPLILAEDVTAFIRAARSGGNPVHSTL